MNRVVKRPYILAFLSLGRFDLSSLFSNTEPNTGILRLRQTFQRDEFGRLSKEHSKILNNTVGGFFLFSIIGGLYSTANIKQKLQDSNLAIKINDYTAGRRIMRSYMTTNFVRTALIVGIRGALIIGVFSTSITMISLYRGKSSLWEYMFPGFLIGSINKIKYGLRGIILGGSWGILLGAFCGVIDLTFLTLTGSRVQDSLKMQYMMENVNEEEKQRLRKLTQLETNILIRSKNLSTAPKPEES